MEEFYIGTIKLVGENFAPHGWAFCDGQLLPISQNIALYSVLGTRYGGNGRTTFALPNLRDMENMSFYQGFGPEQPLRYVICMQGYYPSRD